MQVRYKLKAIFQSQALAVDRNYKDPVKFILQCRIAWAIDELPPLPMANEGLFRRVTVVRFLTLAEEFRDRQNLWAWIFGLREVDQFNYLIPDEPPENIEIDPV